MNRSSRYYPLIAIVECKWANNAYFEQIAAFNDVSVAIGYANDCEACMSPRITYRVIERVGRSWIVRKPASR